MTQPALPAQQPGAAMRPIVLVLNGPNLNLLGQREPHIYGRDTLAGIKAMVEAWGEGFGLEVEFHQSNHEGELIDLIHGARGRVAGIIINAGAYTHTSIAIMDALLGAEVPTIEVHLSNIFKREDFRHHSYIALAAKGVICGLGVQGYLLALEAIKGLAPQDLPPRN